jgi:hypothetical protein
MFLIKTLGQKLFIESNIKGKGFYLGFDTKFIPLRGNNRARKGRYKSIYSARGNKHSELAP